MIITVVTDACAPESGADKTRVVIDVVFVRTEWDISIIGIIILDTTEPYNGISAVNLGGLACAVTVGVAPNDTTCYGPIKSVDPAAFAFGQVICYCTAGNSWSTTTYAVDTAAIGHS